VLDVIMNRLAGFLEKAQRLKKKVAGASVYPAVVMSVAILILTAIIVFVVPAFETMFKAQGLDLPLPTRMLLMLSRGLAGLPGLIALVVIVGGIMGISAWSKTSGGKKKMDAIKLKLPIFGTIIRKSTTSRFCRTLGTLISSGVPILESLTICRNAINNEVLGEAIDTVRASIKEGESIAAPLGKTSLFDDLVVNMIDVGEETGELDKMLVKVADNYDLEVDIAVESLMSVMEPILIVFMGGAIGFIVIALFLPLVSMIENIGV
jgi:type IV pilus assembly protein PilC